MNTNTSLPRNMKEIYVVVDTTSYMDYDLPLYTKDEATTEADKRNSEWNSNFNKPSKKNKNPEPIVIYRAKPLSEYIELYIESVIPDDESI